MILESCPLLAIAPAYARANLADYGVIGERRFKGNDSRQGVVGVVELLGRLSKPTLVSARRTINRFAADENVGEIVIIVDSPGGTSAGCHDLYLAVHEATKQKRVTAVVEDLAASAAYYAICGASEVVANTTASVGSIGVYTVLVDDSRMLERMGIDIIVVRSGAVKGTGIEGAKITTEQLVQIQSVVDILARHFLVAVARGRRMKVDRLQEISDGRILIGTQAIDAGLVDRIGTVEQVLGETALRTRHLMFAELRRGEAKAKFEELVRAEQKRRMISESQATEAIRYQYPKLFEQVPPSTESVYKRKFNYNY